ncbi:hypothetical protein [Rhizobium ruizarguesonis]|uniref:hypothetical protein n=1 Tax=Rhizobium ruizarguesonis TaxID=2081791 RepID=UPI0013C234FC|nr:hypothetical protein [Rhizobium ruizarguesonis]NEJ02623.1 hypothetical protein [Rhizobium ruizarguesonis]NEJ39750.1 hypothetical protein [Rhizobium ruizarguesonis]
MTDKAGILFCSFTAVICLSVAAAAVPQSVANAATKLHANRQANDVKLGKPVYITDVSGKRVRLVGPRFYPDPARALPLRGRSSTLQAIAERH